MNQPLHLPHHVGIIMDGNARWAKKKNLTCREGHQEGAKIILPLIEKAHALGLTHLTLYCFSSENWARPKEEVDHIMSLGYDFISRQLEFFQKFQVRFSIIGERTGIPSYLLKAIEATEEATKDFAQLHLICAVNYGGRQEIAKAALKAAASMIHELPGIADQDMLQLISSHLETQALPEVDLIIRTGGEKRLSNFLLWQAAYSELMFTDVLWPDFTPELFADMLGEYTLRERRFGGR